MDNSVVVSLRDIVVEFDGQRILDGLNLDIHDKEFVTLLGSSGCGKTTTLRLIAGFLEPNAGKVLLKGEDITGVPPYKRPVNTVFQKYALFPHLNVFENVAFGLRLKKLDEDTIRRKVRDMLEVVGLKGFERRSISQMSGGQQQRVAIARSLAGCAGSEAAQGDAAGAQAPAARDEHYLYLRYPRSGGSAYHVRYRRGHERRQGAADRHAGGYLQ